MPEYIEKNHLNERIRVAVGMSEGDLTSDFKDGVLFAITHDEYETYLYVNLFKWSVAIGILDL